jgi:hypothetical protein
MQPLFYKINIPELENTEGENIRSEESDLEK